MVKDRHKVTVEIDATSELAQALKDADARPITLVSDGIEYEVIRVGRIPTVDDRAEHLRALLEPAPGIFSPEEAEELQQNIYKWREAGTRPLPEK